MRRIFIVIIILMMGLSPTNAKADQNSSVANNKKTFEKYQKSADQNNSEGIYNLGLLYVNGQGVKKDMKMAQKLFLRSAKLGYAMAQYNMGIFYFKGILVKKDYGKALKWFSKAAEQSIPEAIYVMGLQYEEGKGTKKNTKKALGYYVRAADLGDNRALERVKKEPLLEKDLEFRQRGIAAYHFVGKNKAIAYLKKSLSIRKKIFGENHINTRAAYHALAKVYEDSGDLPEALSCYQAIQTIQEEVLNKEDPYTLKNYKNISKLYVSMEDYPKALSYLQKALVIEEKVLGKGHIDTAANYDYISMLYDEMGDYPKALRYLQKALVIEEKVWGEEDINTANKYYSLGLLYRKMGDYPKALSYLQKALAISEKVLGKEHPSIATSYSSIGSLYEKMGDYPKALSYLQKALATDEKGWFNDPRGTAKIYGDIGTLYEKIGEFPKALSYLQKALAIDEKVLGKEHTDTATSYNNIGSIHKGMGDYPKAMSYLQKALAIVEKVFGKEHPSTASAYGNISILYDAMGDYPKVLSYNQKALAINEKVFGKEHTRTATSYNNIGLAYKAMGDYPKALSYLQKSLAINEKVLRKEHPSIAASYNNIGSLYQTMGDYPKALDYLQKALAINEKVLGKGHTSTAISYNSLSLLYYSMGEYPKAYKYAKKSFDVFLLNRDKNFVILDNKQKKLYLKQNRRKVPLLLGMAYLYTKSDPAQTKTLAQSGANAWLNYKGSIFDSENTIAMLYASTKNKKLKVKIDDLASSKRYLAKLYQSIPKPKEMKRWKKSINSSEEKISELTKDIASEATSFREQQGLKSVRYQDITSHLKENELYIDYAKAGGYYYLFSLDNKENIAFMQIDQNTTKKIDSLVKIFRDDINTILKDNKISDEKLRELTVSSKEKLSRLYELVIKKPLGETIKDKTSLIISPDGALRLLPFETLYSKESDKYFIEEKEIRYIPSGKELVRLYKYSKDKVSIDKRNAVIFANPSFDSDLNSSKREPVAITPNTSRTAIIKPLFMIEFPPLPGTKAEAKAIKSTFAEGSTIEYLQDDATESNLTKVKQPNILHIATHGFFINDNTIPNPMLKSGIALTGANKSRIKGVGDGIVTALKLSGLDLKGTDLVVLSACQTGVVDINSTDSVSGLSKAFIQAGAKDIVMSLWSVDDQATKELMTSFYQEMKEKKNYAEALKSAKLKMIEEGRHHFYWGAFVLSGL